MIRDFVHEIPCHSKNQASQQAKQGEISGRLAEALGFARLRGKKGAFLRPIGKSEEGPSRLRLRIFLSLERWRWDY
jgi:hypothetical protein